jgi:hypothetical protein
MDTMAKSQNVRTTALDIVMAFNEAFNRHDVDGVDLFRVRDNRISEKFSYVKG